MAERVEKAGVVKGNMSLVPLFALAVLAGAFIAFGAAFYLVVGFQFGLGPGAARLFGGIAFSLGLVLIVVGGAELFTGNNLIVMARCDGLISTSALLRNWAVVYVGNFIGAAATALMISASGILGDGDTDLSGHARNVALAKTNLPLAEAFIRGILCNTLVCLAVWLSFAGHTVTEKAVAIVFPISAFVAMGLEHSVANMFFLPLGVFLGLPTDVGGIAGNLAVVTLGNLIGGSLFVGVVYWIVYRRPG
ncbi:MAG: formate/nitrite transporter family protein [Alphaproteobacteria bacterium]